MRSSAAPATPARRRSTACSRIPSSSGRARLGLARRASAPPRSTRGSNGALPAFVSNDEAAASGADVVFLCLDNEAAAAFEPPPTRSSIDLSGAHRLADDGPRASLVRHRARRVELRAARALSRRTGADRESRLLRDRRAARARRRSPARSRRPSSSTQVGRLRRRPHAKATSHAGVVLENVSPYAVGAHRHAPEIAQQLGFPVCFVPHLLPCAAACSRRVTCRRTLTFAPLLEDAYASAPVVRVLPEGVSPELARVQGTDAAEIGVFDGQRPAPRSSSARSTTSARAPPARRCRTRTSRSASTRRPGCACTGCSYERHCAQGLRRRRACTRASGATSATSRSCARVPLATGAAMWTQNRVLAAPVVVSKRAPRAAQPQAVVINSGVANAATGAQGELDAIATAEHGRALGLAPEQVLVLSTGVIGAPLPIERVFAGVDAAAAAAVGRRRRRRGRGDPDHRHAREGSRRARPGFTVGGMAKGSGMIHPNLATMLAVVTTDYPLEPGEAIGFLRPAVDVCFNAISVDGECSTNDAVVLLASGAARSSGRPRRRGVRARAPHGLRRARAARSSPTARERHCSPRSTSAARPARRRRARSRSASRPRRSSRPRSSVATRTGAACSGRRLRAVQRRLRAARSCAGLASYNGTAVLVGGDRRTSSRRSTAASARSSSTSGSARRAGYLTSDLSYDYVRINAEYRS